uniref:CNNM transmembrane domain-containing protein n=1 Tax=Angiostrongylus cantonensis TaxID=6313 RepID=A0A0K0CZ96_ANGCA
MKNAALLISPDREKRGRKPLGYSDAVEERVKSLSISSQFFMTSGIAMMETIPATHVPSTGWVIAERVLEALGLVAVLAVLFPLQEDVSRVVSELSMQPHLHSRRTLHPLDDARKGLCHANLADVESLADVPELYAVADLNAHRKVGREVLESRGKIAESTASGFEREICARIARFYLLKKMAV